MVTIAQVASVQGRFKPCLGLHVPPAKTQRQEYFIAGQYIPGLIELWLWAEAARIMGGAERWQELCVATKAPPSSSHLPDTFVLGDIAFEPSLPATIRTQNLVGHSFTF